MSHIQTNISWDVLLNDIENLSKQISKPDIVVSISRGGNIPGTVLAYKLGVDKVVNFSVQSYGGETAAKDIKVHQEPHLNDEEIKKPVKVLVVDDLSDKGKTLSFVKEYFTSKGIRPSFCTLYIKEGTSFIPDNYIRKFKDTEWIVFPWD